MSLDGNKRKPLAIEELTSIEKGSESGPNMRSSRSPTSAYTDPYVTAKIEKMYLLV